jgi:hypothetical protein
MDDSGTEEKSRAEKLIAASEALSGVENVRVELYDDFAGDPALRVIFLLRNGFKPDSAWIEAFSTYSTKLTLRLLDSGLKRFPYVVLKDAA